MSRSKEFPGRKRSPDRDAYFYKGYTVEKNREAKRWILRSPFGTFLGMYERLYQACREVDKIVR